MPLSFAPSHLCLCPHFVSLLCLYCSNFYPQIALGFAERSAQNTTQHSSTSALVPLCWALAVAASNIMK